MALTNPGLWYQVLLLLPKLETRCDLRDKYDKFHLNRMSPRWGDRCLVVVVVARCNSQLRQSTPRSKRPKISNAWLAQMSCQDSKQRRRLLLHRFNQRRCPKRLRVKQRPHNILLLSRPQ